MARVLIVGGGFAGTSAARAFEKLKRRDPVDVLLVDRQNFMVFTPMAELPGGRMLTGTPAWLLWRTYYLSRLPGLNKKARVAVDWTLSLAFPPEIAWLPALRNGESPFEDIRETHR